MQHKVFYNRMRNEIKFVLEPMPHKEMESLLKKKEINTSLRTSSCQILHMELIADLDFKIPHKNHAENS